MRNKVSGQIAGASELSLNFYVVNSPAGICERGTYFKQGPFSLHRGQDTDKRVSHNSDRAGEVMWSM